MKMEDMSEIQLMGILTGDYMVSETAYTKYGSLSSISKTPLDKLQSGMGEHDAKILKAALTLAKKMSEEVIAENPRISSPDEAAAVLRERARSLDCETFWVLLLNTKNRLIIPPCEISKGTLNSTLVCPREVFKPAIEHSAASVILAHNHPSGDPTPSSQDIKITQKLIEAGRIIDIKVSDHIIIGRKMRMGSDDFISMRETELVEF